MKWQEDKHPRDDDGKFTEKGEGKQFRQNASYGEILKADKAPRYKKTKKLTSAVYNMISSNRKTLEKHGECEIEVFTSAYKYKALLHGKDDDYDYDVLSRSKI